MDLEFHPDPARKHSEKLPMMDGGTDRNIYSFIPRINLRN
jgi:hypothetical protein